MIRYRYRNTNRGKLTAGEIKQGYIKAFRIPRWRVLLSDVASLLGVGGIFRLADKTYREMTDEDEQRFLEFLETDKTDLEKWVAEDFDCDDFEFRLMGEVHKDKDFAAMPIFITWVRYWKGGRRYGHAVKSYYKDGIVRIVQPQNDWVLDVPGSWRLNMLCG